MARARLSRPLSPYPVLLFHGLRIAQGVAAAIVLGIMSFTVHFLIADGYPVPWTFLIVCSLSLHDSPSRTANFAVQLLSASVVSLLALILTTAIHATRTLSPRHNLFANAALALLWALGLALLSWNLAGLLGGRCDVAHWDHAAGVAVCRLFKALESFATVGTAATLAAVVLDARTQRMVTRRGAYGRMAEPAWAPRDAKVDLAAGAPKAGVVARDDAVLYSDEKVTSREPSMDVAAYARGPFAAYRAGPRPLGAGNFAYEAPSEQTRYDGPLG